VDVGSGKGARIITKAIITRNSKAGLMVKVLSHIEKQVK
jgi:hypothetical protein